jgi:hypothetical protein
VKTKVRECGSAGVREWLAAVGLLVGSSVAGAQVGTTPANSPFVDIEVRHEITFFGGYFSAKRDPAKVAPQSGPMGGLMYAWRASGPVHLGLSAMGVNSKRLILDPSKPVSSREVGTESEPLLAADAFLSVALTGERSWHHLMPMLGMGVGLVTNFKAADVGGFRFGTRFAFPMSAGVRWIPGTGGFQLRADVKDWMYTLKYPQAYYTAAVSGEDPIAAAGVDASRWTHNFAMTVGVSYTFKR